MLIASEVVAANAAPHLLLVGGGHAHALVLRDFALNAPPTARLTLLSRTRLTPYSGMLPGLTAGHYSHQQVHIDLAPLARLAGATFLEGEMAALDPAQRVVTLRSGRRLSYDLLSINTGANSDLRRPGATDYAVPLKPVDHFLPAWERLRTRLSHSAGAARIAMVGGGAAGVEMLLAMRHALRGVAAAATRCDGVEFHLFTCGGDILTGHHQTVRRRFRKILHDSGVKLHTGRCVDRVVDGALAFEDGGSFACDAVFWGVGAGPPDWAARGGAAIDADGFLQVTETLQSPSHPNIFAAGDVAGVIGRPRPKAGVFAVRQGPVLAANLRRFLQGRPLLRYNPQRRFLALIATGDKSAVACRGAFAASGRWVWRWKDSIDSSFMRRFDPSLLAQRAARRSTGP